MEFDLEQLEFLRKQRELTPQNSDRTVKISNPLGSDLLINYSGDIRDVISNLYLCLL